MQDLDIDIAEVVTWFVPEIKTSHTFIRVPEEKVNSWSEILGVPVRQCYIDDTILNQSADHPKSEVLASKLPNPGSVMAGDFGEIIVFLYHAASEHPKKIIGPKKWRLKQDRTKAAPHSDVVHFIVPSWPTPSENDVLLCSEVKTKSTHGQWRPIEDGIKDCLKDRTSRLAKTLVWLRERALTENLGSVTERHLKRFINLTDYPPIQKKYRAVAVICSSLVEEELRSSPSEASSEYELVVITIPNLKECYQTVFEAVHATVTGE